MASLSPRTANLTLCTKCLHLVEKLKTLSCLHTFCQNCIKSWAQENLNSTIPCPYCSKVTFVPLAGIRTLPDHFQVKLQHDKDVQVQTEVKQEPAKTQKPKALKQVQKDWNAYFEKVQANMLAAVDVLKKTPKQEDDQDHADMKGKRETGQDMDKMYTQTAIQRALVAGDILRANVALSKGESPPSVEVSEECYQQLLDIHREKLEQVHFAIEHTKETNTR